MGIKLEVGFRVGSFKIKIILDDVYFIKLIIIEKRLSDLNTKRSLLY